MKEAIERRKLKNRAVRFLVQKAQKLCLDYFGEDYEYSPAKAIEELGVDLDLIDHLVEDYVIQIIKSDITAKKYLAQLKADKQNNKELDYSDFRDLAHKNLGVARNLRIEDSEKVLIDLLKKDDLEYLEHSLEILKACTIKLNPVSAYDALYLVQIKSSF
ncbi:MAG: hypothetical protein U9Q40_09070 [Campylobacterota bacterium]|nr:hypothetical protein [Campylobacterota bacterium]